MVKILVVEDNNSELELLAHILKERGYSPVLASSTDIAKTKIAEDKPELVLTDIIMAEGMNGFEFCRWLYDSNLLLPHPT